MKSRVHSIPTKKGNENAEFESTGLVLMDIDSYDKFCLNVISAHARICSGNLEVVDQVKKGYELDRTYFCDTCGKRHVFRTGPSNDKDQPKKQGQQMRSIIKIMSIALFNAGTPQQQMLEIFHEAGIVSPSKKGQAKMLDKVYEEAKRVSLKQLKKNCFKHVKACRKMENYSGTISF